MANCSLNLLSEKSNYEVVFRVQKRGKRPEILIKKFIGNEDRFGIFVQEKRRKLLEDYDYVNMLGKEVLPPDARLIFGDNIL